MKTWKYKDETLRPLTGEFAALLDKAQALYEEIFVSANANDAHWSWGNKTSRKSNIAREATLNYLKSTMAHRLVEFGCDQMIMAYLELYASDEPTPRWSGDIQRGW